MNKRIEQLYEQALVTAGKENQFDTTNLRVAEKFARSIILECLIALDTKVPARIGVHAMNAIVEHFGYDETNEPTN